MNGNVPPVQVLGDAALLQGIALYDALGLVTRGMRSFGKLDEIPEARRWHQLKRALEVAYARSTSDPRTSELREVDDQAPLTPEESIGTAEVARILAVSRRWAQELAGRLGARTVGRALVFDRAAVEAYAARPGAESHD